MLRLADVDIAVAQAEGEGYNAVSEWRHAHEAFWNTYADELRSRLGDPAWRLVDETPVVVERFRLINRLDTRPARPSTKPERPPRWRRLNAVSACAGGLRARASVSRWAAS